MLTKFSAENFKNFREKIEWDLAVHNNYEFNCEAIGDHSVMKAIILGNNGSGKSNFGLAIFDIIHHLTDKNKREEKYDNYLNLHSASNRASFEYHFVFQGVEVVYKYLKTSSRQLLWEQLMIDNKEVIAFDFIKNTGITRLEGTENLNLSSNNLISRVKYIKSNAILVENQTNAIFYEFIDFVDRMLMFYSLDNRGYQGFINGSESIAKGIIESGKLNDFEEFLHTQGVDYKLVEREIDGNKSIYCVFEEGEVNFYSVASTGTKSLALFYYWLVKMDSASLVYIDEFDAFYHFELSKQVVKRVKQLNSTQVFLTSHNTDLISNDLLRPDCYFIINNGQIRNISERTDKELRKAHNLQKMYKAGMFDEE